MVLSRALQRLQRRLTRNPIPLHNNLRMNLHSHQFLRLPQQLRTQHANARRPIAHLVVLHFTNIHQYLRRRVVQLDRFEDRGAVVGDGDFL